MESDILGKLVLSGVGVDDLLVCSIVALHLVYAIERPSRLEPTRRHLPERELVP